MTLSNRSKIKPLRAEEARQLTFRLDFEAIGTTWSVESALLADSASATDLGDAISAKIEVFDRAYSRFRDDSLVSAMARRAGWYDLPKDAAPMLAIYRRLYDLTAGAMTPLIGQVLSDTGYDAHYTLRPGTPIPPSDWDDILEYQSDGRLLMHRPALLDFGAAGKGYLADQLGDIMMAHGCLDFCIDAGGDIVRQGSGSLRVGLEHPDAAGQVIGVANLAIGALCGSAGNRRTWGQYHHVIDPHKLASPRHIQALWVYAADGLTADALSTALFFVSPSRLADEFEFEYAIISQDMKLARSPGFPAEFFMATREGDL